VYFRVRTSIITDCEGDVMMQQKKVMASLFALLVIVALTSCGKRGDPYRPSEIPTQKTNN
jgi:hypothetical protein